MDKQKVSKFEKLYQQYNDIADEIAQLAYDVMKRVVMDAGGKIDLNFKDDDEELEEIYYEYFSAVPYVDEEQISIYFGDAGLVSLFMGEDGLYYELSDERRCHFRYMPPHFSTSICEGLIKWSEITQNRK